MNSAGLGGETPGEKVNSSDDPGRTISSSWQCCPMSSDQVVIKTWSWFSWVTTLSHLTSQFGQIASRYRIGNMI